MGLSVVLAGGRCASRRRPRPLPRGSLRWHSRVRSVAAVRYGRTRLKESLGKLLAALPAGDSRPMVIFEFRPAESSGGYTGDFEPAWRWPAIWPASGSVGCEPLLFARDSRRACRARRAGLRRDHHCAPGPVGCCRPRGKAFDRIRTWRRPIAKWQGAGGHSGRRWS